MDINTLNTQELHALDTLLTKARQQAHAAKERARVAYNDYPSHDNDVDLRQTTRYYHTLQSLSTKLDSTFNLIAISR